MLRRQSMCLLSLVVVAAAVHPVTALAAVLVAVCVIKHPGRYRQAFLTPSQLVVEARAEMEHQELLDQMVVILYST